MCGIVGYCGKREAKELLISGLKRLEYRGYDSSGICILNSKGDLSLYKKVGKIRALESILPKKMDGVVGIAHTRWATHGGVTDENAHPHLDMANKISVVHNGIIENDATIRDHLKKDGVKFRSETDSEVIPHLIAKFYKGDFELAFRQALSVLKGTYGIICMHADHPNTLLGARNGSPLVLGIGNDEMILASDVSAMIAYTKQVVFFEDGEIVKITPDSFVTSDLENSKIEKKIDSVSWDAEEMEKGSYSHYMLKEIYEQVQSIPRAIQGRLNIEDSTAHLGGLNMSSRELLNIERIKIIAAGTSFHAGQVAAYLIESLARVPCIAELASEVRYRNPIVERNSLHFAITQSGETIDTLFAMREIQRKGGKVLGICNVVGSTIARESDGGVYIHSGPEIAVASTKAFTSQISALYLFALNLARMKDLSWNMGHDFLDNLNRIPSQIETILAHADKVATVAKKYAHCKDVLYLGRGINYPVALEGALKLKEISYIHAEGYSSAEIKHGPIALINEETPSLFLISDDRMRGKVISSMREIKARKGPVIAICVEGDMEVADIADDTIFIPATHELFYPYLFTVPLQLFAYYCALELERDVDQPRNLAKSVTVE